MTLTPVGWDAQLAVRWARSDLASIVLIQAPQRAFSEVHATVTRTATEQRPDAPLEWLAFDKSTPDAPLLDLNHRRDLLVRCGALVVVAVDGPLTLARARALAPDLASRAELFLDLRWVAEPAPWSVVAARLVDRAPQPAMDGEPQVDHRGFAFPRALGFDTVALPRATIPVAGERVVWVGPPESGKTFSLREVALRLVREGDPKAWPLLVDLSGVLGGDGVVRTVRQLVAEALDPEGAMGAVGAAVEGAIERLVLLLDGLDAIRQPVERQRVLDEVAQLPAWAVVVTTRDHGLVDVVVPSGMDLRPMAPLTRDEADALARRYAIGDVRGVQGWLDRHPWLARWPGEVAIAALAGAAPTDRHVDLLHALVPAHPSADEAAWDRLVAGAAPRTAEAFAAARHAVRNGLTEALAGLGGGRADPVIAFAAGLLRASGRDHDAQTLASLLGQLADQRRDPKDPVWTAILAEEVPVPDGLRGPIELELSAGVGEGGPAGRPITAVRYDNLGAEASHHVSRSTSSNASDLTPSGPPRSRPPVPDTGPSASWVDAELVDRVVAAVSERGRVALMSRSWNGLHHATQAVVRRLAARYDDVRQVDAAGCDGVDAVRARVHRAGGPSAEPPQVLILGGLGDLIDEQARSSLFGWLTDLVDRGSRVLLLTARAPGWPAIDVPPMPDAQVDALLRPWVAGQAERAALVALVAGNPLTASLVAGLARDRQDATSVLADLRLRLQATGADAATGEAAIAAALDGLTPPAMELLRLLALVPWGVPVTVGQDLVDDERGVETLARRGLLSVRHGRCRVPGPVRRRVRRFDRADGLGRVAEAMTTFLAETRALLASDAPAALDRVLAERETLAALAEAGGVGPRLDRALPKLATEADPLLVRGSLWEIARALVEAGRAAAVAMGDRLGEANTLRGLGDLRRRTDDLAGAEQAYAEALPLFRAIGDRLGEANTLRSLGDLRMRTDDHAGAEQAYSEALAIFREIRARLGEANTLQRLGDLRLRASDLAGAEQAYAHALSLYRAIGHRLGEANTLRGVGDLRMRTDDLAGAEQAYAQALPIFREIRERLGEANTFHGLGDLRMRTDDLAGAEQAYAQALPIFRAIGDRLGEANTLRSLGDLRVRTSDLAGAEQAYIRALPVFREIHARLGEANTLQSLGDLRMRTSDLAGAEQAYAQALPIFRAIGDRLGEANALKSLGDLRMRTDDLVAAVQAYANALRIFREIRHRLGEANTLESMARLALVQDRRAEGFRLLLSARALYREADSLLGEQAALGNLARACLGRPDQALVLAERSLVVGRHIGDVMGQAITHHLQLELFLQQEVFDAAIATAAIASPLAHRAHLPDEAEAFDHLLAAARTQVPAHLLEPILADPEPVRTAAIAAAEARLRAASVDVWDPPP